MPKSRSKPGLIARAGSYPKGVLAAIGLLAALGVFLLIKIHADSGLVEINGFGGIGEVQTNGITLAAFPLSTDKQGIVTQNGAGFNDHNLDLTWCWWQTTNCHHDYNAADIFANQGTTVVSATAGVVFSIHSYGSCNDSAEGSRVAILGTDGHYYAYYHMGPNTIPSSLSEGDKVSPGTVLGKVGPSACAEGADTHLHFQVTTVPPPSCKDAGCSNSEFIDPQGALVVAFYNHLNSWRALAALPSGLKMRDIGIKSSMWAEGSDGRLYHYLGGGRWQQIAGTGTCSAEGGNLGWRINCSDHNKILLVSGTTVYDTKATGLDIGASASGSAVWAVGTNGRLGKWNGSTSNPAWSSVSNSGTARRVDATAGGNAWYVTNESGDNVYTWNGSKSTKLSGHGQDIAIGGDNGVWVVGSNGKAYHWNGSGWDQIPSTPTTTRISADSSGRPWVIDSAGHALAYWRNFP